LEQPVPPSLLNPAIPDLIEQVILRALEKDPHHRFHSVQAMAQAFEQAIKVPQPLFKAHARTTLSPGQQALSLQKMHQHPTYSALAALVAIMLFALSLSLGFFAYVDGLHGQLPPALSA